MKIAVAVLAPVVTIAAVAAILPFAARASSGHDFDAVVAAVSARYPAHVEEAPMMGLVSLCARVATGDGVKGMKVAEFENLRQPPDGAALDRIVTGALGSDWQRFVTTRSRDGETTLIFSQPDGEAMRLLIADYEHGELDVVRVEVNGERMQQWLNDPRGSAQRHDYGRGSGSVPD